MGLLQQLVEKFAADQPRVPKGDPAGGRWVPRSAMRTPFSRDLTAGEGAYAFKTLKAARASGQAEADRSGQPRYLWGGSYTGFYVGEGHPASGKLHITVQGGSDHIEVFHPTIQKYAPGQPRKPKGDPAGGQFAPKGYIIAGASTEEAVGHYTGKSRAEVMERHIRTTARFIEADGSRLQGTEMYTGRHVSQDKPEVAEARLARAKMIIETEGHTLKQTSPGSWTAYKGKAEKARVTTQRLGLDVNDEDLKGFEVPSVDWHAKDNNDDGTEAGILASYGRPGDHIYRAIVPNDAIAAPKLAGGVTGYGGGWSDLQRPHTRGLPPIKLRVNRNGTVTVLDGNHRLFNWREQGQDWIPAWVLDGRRVVDIAKYNPDQPRVPAGDAKGGQFAARTGAEPAVEDGATDDKVGLEVEDFSQEIDLHNMPADPITDGVTLYHVTADESAQAIQFEGFDANHPNQFQGFASRFKGVYGWSSKARAIFETQRFAELNDGSFEGLAIVEVRVPASHFHNMRPDEDAGITVPWRQSYDEGSVAYEGSTPPEWVQTIYIPKAH